MATWNTAVKTRQAAEAQSKADYDTNLAQADADFADKSGDVDVWAAEQSANDAKDATNRSFNALKSLGSSRSVGGGSFNSLVSGRGAINLGSISGGLAAANTAKVSEAKKKDLQGDLAASKGLAAAKQKASTDLSLSKYVQDYQNEQAAKKGWSLGYFTGNYRARKNPETGEIEYSDALGQFASDR